MLSVTKHCSSQYDPDAAESRLEFLSLTQESYIMPLPERSKLGHSHSSQDSASPLANQLHRSTSRDFYNIPKNQSQNELRNNENLRKFLSQKNIKEINLEILWSIF